MTIETKTQEKFGFGGCFGIEIAPVQKTGVESGEAHTYAGDSNPADDDGAINADFEGLKK